MADQDVNVSWLVWLNYLSSSTDAPLKKSGIMKIQLSRYRNKLYFKIYIFFFLIFYFFTVILA